MSSNSGISELNDADHGKDVGEIMRVLNIGVVIKDRVRCSSKNDMLKKKEDILRRIYAMWSDQ